jgi:hypothetical protein
MVNSLGLDDDLDSVEIVKLVELAFDIRIANEEAEAITNVGELYDLLLKKIPRDEANRKCASAMAFYRLRRALVDLRTADKLTPGSDMTSRSSVYAKPLFRELEARTGLNMPRPAFSWVGKTGGWIALAWLIAALVDASLFVMHGAIPGSLSLFCWSALPAAYLFAQFDPGRLPKDCPTLGALAKKVAALSYGKLVKAGANASDSAIWTAMLEVLSSFNGFPADQITRETLFLESQQRKTAKVAA